MTTSNQATPQSLNVFTDGSCREGKGGWALVVQYADRSELHMSGFHPSTTNNRMEMTAALSALEGTKDHPGSLTIHTDSEYVLKGMTQWLQNWKRGGWVTSSGSDVVNIDLWKQLDQACRGRDIRWVWVRGHAGHPENEQADVMAGIAARTQVGKVGYFTSDEIDQSRSDIVPGSRAAPIAIDITMSDEHIASLVREGMVKAKGKIVRFREAT